MKTLSKSILSLSVVALALGGCTTTPNEEMTAIQTQLDETKQQNTNLLGEIDRAKSTITNQEERISRLASESQGAITSASTSAESELLPPNAKPGECYARVLVPATYKSESKDVLQKQASYRLEVAPAKHEWVEERVLVKEASETAKLIPAKYDWVTEKVLVKEAYDKVITIPASYEKVTEQILVKPAYTTWKKGRGPIERIDNATGEIVCLVEVPAQYKTITKKMMVKEPTTETIQIPAEYKEIKKRVMLESPKLEKVTIPEEYKTVKVKKVATPAQSKRIEIPATYQTITNRIKTTDSYLEWRSILCETNTSAGIIGNIQRALLNAGHNPGPIDGVIGGQTMAALKSYQREKNIAAGQITMETLKSLGVSL